jgi:mRNA-degrading endonuclease RelE of RelBE toxin-antitoxin system
VQLRYEPRAVRALKKLRAVDRVVIVDALEAFAAGRLPNANVRKLHAVNPSTWRLRVGNFRALYQRREMCCSSLTSTTARTFIAAEPPP